jgi:hypothetical protein
VQSLISNVEVDRSEVPKWMRLGLKGFCCPFAANFFADWTRTLGEGLGFRVLADWTRTLGERRVCFHFLTFLGFLLSFTPSPGFLPDPQKAH